VSNCGKTELGSVTNSRSGERSKYTGADISSYTYTSGAFSDLGIIDAGGAAT
jgi:hypothetical protein